MSGDSSIPLNSPQFLNEDSVLLVLALALAKKSPPQLCSQLFAPTHAAGTAVAGFASLAIVEDMRLLRDLADVCCGEMAIEYLYTIAKLIEHNIIANMFASLIGCICSNPLNFGSTKDKIQDVESLCTIGIIGHDLPSQFTKLLTFVDDFRSRIMRQMQDVIVRATNEGWDMKEVEYRNAVDPVLREAMLCLWCIKEALEEIVNTLESMVTKIQSDWQKDFEQTSRCSGQQPGNRQGNCR